MAGSSSAVQIQDKLLQIKASVVPLTADPTKNGLVICNADGSKITGGGGGGGHTIQDEGVSLAQRTKLNFVGSGVAVTDGGAGLDSTIVTIGGGTPTLTATQIAFGSATNTLTSVAGLTYDNTSRTLAFSDPNLSLHFDINSGGDDSIFRLIGNAGASEFYISSDADTSGFHMVGGGVAGMSMTNDGTRATTINMFDGGDITIAAGANGGSINFDTGNTNRVEITTGGAIGLKGITTAPNFISNVAIGTSPYATTSTTLNTNLNADLLDGNHAAAFQAAGTYVAYTGAVVSAASAADGFSVTGGTTPRTLTATGANMTMTGSGTAVYTYPSATSTLLGNNIGIAGGTTLIGGTATTDALVLRSTSGVGTTAADIIFQTGTNGATERMRIYNTGTQVVSISSAVPGAIGNGWGLYLKSANGLNLGQQLFLSNTSGTYCGIVFNQADNNAGIIQHVGAYNTGYIQISAVPASPTLGGLCYTYQNRLGLNVVSPTYDLSFDNGAAKIIWIENTANTVVGRALTIQAGSTVTAGTADMAGGNLILNAGLGKGTGASSIIFSVGRTLTTGSTLHTLTQALAITGDLKATFAGSITSAALTATRIPFIGTSGLIQDSANLTFRDTTYTQMQIGVGTNSGDYTEIAVYNSAGAFMSQGINKSTASGGGIYGTAQMSYLSTNSSTAAGCLALGATGSAGFIAIYTGGSAAANERARFDVLGNFLIHGTAARGTTAGVGHLDLFNGTDPAGTLTNGLSVYSSGGLGYIMDAAGVRTAIGYAHTIFTPVTTNSITLINNQNNLVNPAGTIAVLTMVFPASPLNNDQVTVKFTQIVTAITYTAGTGGATILSQVNGTVGGNYTWTYDLGNNIWY